VRLHFYSRSTGAPSDFGSEAAVPKAGGVDGGSAISQAPLTTYSVGTGLGNSGSDGGGLEMFPESEVGLETRCTVVMIEVVGC
jgi:hypothetical protein